MSIDLSSDALTASQAQLKIESMERGARDLAALVERSRQQALLQTNERIESLEQKARDLARLVETTRQQTLLQSDRRAEHLEQQARDLAHRVEALRNQTRVQSDTEIEALGQNARDLARFVESVRKETRLQSEMEIALLGRQAQELAASVETAREETLLHSDTEIQGLKQQARNLADRVERSRLQTLTESDRVIRRLNEELEQRVMERTGQLEAANKELESFSYSVSHDLRAPLRAIDGFSRIVLEDFSGPLPPEARTYLGLVCDNTRHMAQLVDDLLAFSRLSRQALTKRCVDPTQIVRECLSEMSKEQEGRQLEVVVEDLESCMADPTLLKQVWTNLISNALKYTRKRASAHVRIGCRTAPRPLADGHAPHLVPRATEVIYFVQDDGAGFDMRYAHKLFGVFQRLHRAADYDGTGVGLAIVQRIVLRHGGRVWGEAALDQGATFSFTLD